MKNTGPFLTNEAARRLEQSQGLAPMLQGIQAKDAVFVRGVVISGSAADGYVVRSVPEGGAVGSAIKLGDLENVKLRTWPEGASLSAGQQVTLLYMSGSDYPLIWARTESTDVLRVVYSAVARCEGLSTGLFNFGSNASEPSSLYPNYPPVLHAWEDDFIVTEDSSSGSALFPGFLYVFDPSRGMGHGLRPWEFSTLGKPSNAIWYHSPLNEPEGERWVLDARTAAVWAGRGTADQTPPPLTQCPT